MTSLGRTCRGWARFGMQTTIWVWEMLIMPSLGVHRHGGGSEVRVRNSTWSQNSQVVVKTVRGDGIAHEDVQLAGAMGQGCSFENTKHLRGDSGRRHEHTKAHGKGKSRRRREGRSVAGAGALPVSQHLTSRQRRLLTANTCSLPEGFFLAVETLLAPDQGKPEVLESYCAWKQPSTNDQRELVHKYPSFRARGAEDARHVACVFPVPPRDCASLAHVVARPA